MTNIITYLASAAIIGAYIWSVRNPKRAFFFHLANALGGIPLLLTEYLTGAYAVMPVTAAFTLVGWWGVGKDWFSIDWSGPLTLPPYVHRPDTYAEVVEKSLRQLDGKDYPIGPGW